MSGYVLTWNGVASSTIPQLVVTKLERGGFGTPRDSLIAVPGRLGRVAFTDERDNRRVVARCKVVAPIDQRHAACEAVADWLDVLGYQSLIVDDRPDRQFEAILTSDINPDEWRRKADFDIEWSAAPYLTATALSTDVEAVSGSGSASGTITLPDAVWAEPIIELQPTNGTITGFSLNIGGTILSYTAPTITSGSTVTISTISDTVTSGVNGDTMLTGAYNPANLKMGFVSGGFPILEPGVNNYILTWSGTATAITMTTTWRRRYR